MSNSSTNPIAVPTTHPPAPTHSLPIPELLAPAGDWDCARAAVENGADAIYFGLSRFNARMRAKNFTEADLPSLMEFLHHRGVRGYVTFNTLVFANELPEAEDYLRSIIAAGVDAAIVQDVGICRLIRQLSPDFPIHASTQMTISSLAGVEFARNLGCQLVVLARECSITEIEKINQAQSQSPALSTASQSSSTPPSPNPPPIPLEVFVHGALCVAYSGQCLTSESLGGRSANRGECAQACRLPYDLIVDGKPLPLGDKKYLLSPQDLAGLEVLPNLVRSGVRSLKIEGRLKSPEYVASVTRVYRQALDRLRPNSSSQSPSTPESHAHAHANHTVSTRELYELEMSFSRGLYSGWFKGINNQDLVHARFGKKRGVYLGQVTSIKHDRVTLQLESPLKPGDGVVFDAGKPEQPEEGGRVYSVEPPGPVASPSRPISTTITFGRDALRLDRIQPGDRLWKTSDPELEREVQRTFQSTTILHRRPIHFTVHGAPNSPLTIIARDDEGHIAQCSSAMPLVPALKRPLQEPALREQLGRLGDSVFTLGSLTLDLPDGLMLPISELNRIRRDLTANLEAQRRTPKRWTLLPNSSKSASTSNFKTPLSPDSASPTTPSANLVVLVRNLDQLKAALHHPISTFYCEFEDPKRYREAVVEFRNLTRNDTSRTREIFVAPPRIFKTGEEWILKIVESSEPDGVLVRNFDHLQKFAHRRCIGDFSLNVANHLTALHFHQHAKLEFLTASYDLNQEQLLALLNTSNPNWFEITIHQHMPMFHMEHCVFCAFMSSGKDYHDCGRPCEKHSVQLRDRVGALHPLKADAGCRNTLFNALAQTGAEFLPQFIQAGARRFRIEFLNESPDEVDRTLTMYQKLLDGRMTGHELWQSLKLKHQLGVTRGQMERRETWQ